MLADKIFALLTGFLVGRLVGRIVKGFFDFYDTKSDFFEKADDFRSQIESLIKEILGHISCEDNFQLNFSHQKNVFIFHVYIVIFVMNEFGMVRPTFMEVLGVEYIPKHSQFLMTVYNQRNEKAIIPYDHIGDILKGIKDELPSTLCGYFANSDFFPHYLESLCPNKQEPKQ